MATQSTSRRLIVAVVLATMVAAFLATSSDPAHATFRGRTGRIAWSEFRAGSWNLYTVAPDATGWRQVTTGQGDEIEPSYSPDGTRIAFAGSRVTGGAHQIWVVDADGRHLHRITSDAASDDRTPSWSPDGRSLAYVRYVGGGARISTIRVDGTRRRDLTSGGFGDFDPAYSPDGRLIAFGSSRSYLSQIFTMHLDGSHVVQVTDDAGLDSGPSWSGDWIAYLSNGTPTPTIQAIDTRSHDALTVDTAPDGTITGPPAFSPDGRQVAFATDRGGSWSIQRVAMTGGAYHLVTPMDSDGDTVSWGATPTRCGGRWATLTGTPGADALVGTAGPDVIAGLAGNDTILGLGGDDVICGGRGRDDLEGGAGNDSVLARDATRDTSIACGAGADRAVVDAIDPTPRSC